MSRADQTGVRDNAATQGRPPAGAPSGPEAAAGRALAEAAESGDAARVSSLLASGAFADSRLRGGETPLMRASARGYADVARVLLDAGADASARRGDGFTPLILAAFFGHEEVVRLLVERGADADARTVLGTTAEQWAESRGFGGVTSLLRGAARKGARAGSDATRAKAPGDPLEDVGVFSRKGAAAGVEVSRDSSAGSRKTEEGAAVGASSSSAGATAREGKSAKGRVIISIRDEGPEPAHPSESSFQFGRFMRSWQASVGTALLLVAFGVGAYALWRRGGARENPRPAPAPQQSVAQQPAPAQVLPAQPPQATPLAPEAQPVAPAEVYPSPDAAAQPYNVPPAPYVPPQSNIPRELTVVSESGAPAADDSARAKRKSPSGDASATPQPAREGGDQKADPDARGDVDRTARAPDTEARPAPTPRPTAPPPPSNPDRGKVIQWPP